MESLLLKTGLDLSVALGLDLHNCSVIYSSTRTSWGLFKRIEPLSNHLITEIAKCVEFFQSRVLMH